MTITPEERRRFLKMPFILLSLYLKCRPVELIKELWVDEEFHREYAKESGWHVDLVKGIFGGALYHLKRGGKPHYCIGNRIDPDMVLSSAKIRQETYEKPGRYQLLIRDQIELIDDYYSLPAGLIGYVEEPGNFNNHDPIVEFPIYDTVSNQLLTVETIGVPLDMMIMTHKYNQVTHTHDEMFVDIAYQAGEMAEEAKQLSDQVFNDYIASIYDEVKVEKDYILYRFF